MSTDNYGIRALIDQEFVLPSEERLQRTLADPGARGAMSVPSANKVTLARLRYALADFAYTNGANIQKWLEEVANVNPQKALELYMELLQFSVPKLKATAIELHDTSPNPKQLSVADLHKIISEQ
jgi:hypothetical protein